MKKIFWIAAIIIIVLAIYFVWDPFTEDENSNGNATKISTAVVKRANLAITVSSTGIVQPVLTVDLKSKASGEIIELPIEEGDIVKKGDLIARLDAQTTRNIYDQAVAEYQGGQYTNVLQSASLCERELTFIVNSEGWME